MKCNTCNRNNSSGMICNNCINRTLTDVRRKQQSVKNAIYLNRQSDSVKGLVDTVKRTKGHYDAARMSTRLDKLDKEISERIHANNNKLRDKRNDIISRRHKLRLARDQVGFSQSQNTRRSSSLTFLELKESRRVLALECLNIYGLRGLQDGMTVIAGVLVPPLHKLQCLSHLHLLFIASTLAQILQHLSNYLSLPLPFTAHNVSSYAPTIALSETNKVFLADTAPCKTTKHVLPSLQALSMLVYNISFILSVSGYTIEHTDIVYVVNLLSRIEDSPELGAQSFAVGAPSLTSFSSLKLPLSAVTNVLSNNNMLHLSSSSTDESEDQWEVVD
ncbi:hypothetical protein E3Q18_03254 [Wallemia mellicola]|nr:hypothetical protein E3Q18_03254 [Wallemia mellicola]